MFVRRDPVTTATLRSPATTAEGCRLGVGRAKAFLAGWCASSTPIGTTVIGAGTLPSLEATMGMAGPGVAVTPLSGARGAATGGGIFVSGLAVARPATRGRHRRRVIGGEAATSARTAFLLAGPFVGSTLGAWLVGVALRPRWSRRRRSWRRRGADASATAHPHRVGSSTMALRGTAIAFPTSRYGAGDRAASPPRSTRSSCRACVGGHGPPRSTPWCVSRAAAAAVLFIRVSSTGAPIFMVATGTAMEGPLATSPSPEERPCPRP